jgi:hypothetical protein
MGSEVQTKAVTTIKAKKQADVKTRRSVIDKFSTTIRPLSVSCTFYRVSTNLCLLLGIPLSNTIPIVQMITTSTRFGSKERRRSEGSDSLRSVVGRSVRGSAGAITLIASIRTRRTNDRERLVRNTHHPGFIRPYEAFEGRYEESSDHWTRVEEDEKPRGLGAALAPPAVGAPANTSGEEAYQRRLAMSAMSGEEAYQRRLAMSQGLRPTMQDDIPPPHATAPTFTPSVPMFTSATLAEDMDADIPPPTSPTIPALSSFPPMPQIGDEDDNVPDFLSESSRPVAPASPPPLAFNPFAPRPGPPPPPPPALVEAQIKAKRDAAAAIAARLSAFAADNAASGSTALEPAPAEEQEDVVSKRRVAFPSFRSIMHVNLAYQTRPCRFRRPYDGQVGS